MAITHKILHLSESSLHSRGIVSSTYLTARFSTSDSLASADSILFNGHPLPVFTPKEAKTHIVVMNVIERHHLCCVPEPT